MLDLLEYWSANPPLHLMVRSYLGIESPDEEDDVFRPQTQEEIEALIRTFGG